MLEQGGADKTEIEQLLADILAASGGSPYNYITSEEDATYKYYGFYNGTSWKFKRKTLATGVWMIASGTGDFDTNWADNAAKTYTYA